LGILIGVHMLPASFPRPYARRYSRLYGHVIAAMTALAIALPAAPAFALNQRERDVLKGVAGVLLFQEVLRHSNKAQPQREYSPRDNRKRPPVVHAPPQPAPTHYVSVSRTPAAYAFSSYSASERRAIQRSLARAGYYNGHIDGVFGYGTYHATLGYARRIRAEGSLHTQAGAYGVYDRLLYGTH
jgi:hypothetical protein